MLCTDGITDGLWEKGLSAELACSEGATRCSSRLLERARDNSGSDDATLIIADIAEL